MALEYDLHNIYLREVQQNERKCCSPSFMGVKLSCKRLRSIWVLVYGFCFSCPVDFLISDQKYGYIKFITYKLVLRYLWIGNSILFIFLLGGWEQEDAWMSTYIFKALFAYAQHYVKRVISRHEVSLFSHDWVSQIFIVPMNLYLLLLSTPFLFQ